MAGPGCLTVCVNVAGCRIVSHRVRKRGVRRVGQPHGGDRARGGRSRQRPLLVLRGLRRKARPSLGMRIKVPACSSAGAGLRRRDTSQTDNLGWHADSLRRRFSKKSGFSARIGDVLLWAVTP